MLRAAEARLAEHAGSRVAQQARVYRRGANPTPILFVYSAADAVGSSSSNLLFGEVVFLFFLRVQLGAYLDFPNIKTGSL